MSRAGKFRNQVSCLYNMECVQKGTVLRISLWSCRVSLSGGSCADVLYGIVFEAILQFQNVISGCVYVALWRSEVGHTQVSLYLCASPNILYTCQRMFNVNECKSVCLMTWSHYHMLQRRLLSFTLLSPYGHLLYGGLIMTSETYIPK